MLTEGVTKEFKEKEELRIPAKEDCNDWLEYEERK